MPVSSSLENHAEVSMMIALKLESLGESTYLALNSAGMTLFRRFKKA
jgi:hypothetical protein